MQFNNENDCEGVFLEFRLKHTVSTGWTACQMGVGVEHDM